MDKVYQGDFGEAKRLYPVNAVDEAARLWHVGSPEVVSTKSLVMGC